MSPQECQDLLLDLSTATNLEEITAFCRRQSRRMGFEHFIYALRIPDQFSESRVIMLNGYPDAWIEHYWKNGYAALDPVIQHCSRHVVPILWQELPSDAATPVARVMAEAGEFGMKTGVSMPVHSPQGSLGILSFATGTDDPDSLAAVRSASPYIQLLAVHIHEAIQRVCGGQSDNIRTQLTPRETECLRWAADGKTSWEIGQLLSMSERTVNFHFNNAMTKLNVMSRQHAIAKAILHGLINPAPF